MGSGADAVVFDLEDSVDAARKADGRRAIAEAPRPQPAADEVDEAADAAP